jgi:hypothetical protein
MNACIAAERAVARAEAGPRMTELARLSCSRESDVRAIIASANCSLIARKHPSERAAMRFSWTGLILAPLLVPTIFSVAMQDFLGSSNVMLSFLFLMISSCIISYGATIFLFRPSLYLLSLWRLITGLKVCLLGLVLGMLAFVPLTLMMWKGRGPDSGPPTESFLTFLVRWAADPLTAIFPLAGLITAALYWWLATRRRARPSPQYSGAGSRKT